MKKSRIFFAATFALILGLAGCENGFGIPKINQTESKTKDGLPVVTVNFAQASRNISPVDDVSVTDLTDLTVNFYYINADESETLAETASLTSDETSVEVKIAEGTYRIEATGNYEYTSSDSTTTATVKYSGEVNKEITIGEDNSVYIILSPVYDSESTGSFNYTLTFSEAVTFDENALTSDLFTAKLIPLPSGEEIPLNVTQNKDETTSAITSLTVSSSSETELAAGQYKLKIICNSKPTNYNSEDLYDYSIGIGDYIVDIIGGIKTEGTKKVTLFVNPTINVTVTTTDITDEAGETNTITNSEEFNAAFETIKTEAKYNKKYIDYVNIQTIIENVPSIDVSKLATGQDVKVTYKETNATEYTDYFSVDENGIVTLLTPHALTLTTSDETNNSITVDGWSLETDDVGFLLENKVSINLTNLYIPETTDASSASKISFLILDDTGTIQNYFNYVEDGSGNPLFNITLATGSAELTYSHIDFADSDEYLPRLITNKDSSGNIESYSIYVIPAATFTNEANTLKNAVTLSASKTDYVGLDETITLTATLDKSIAEEDVTFKWTVGAGEADSYLTASDGTTTNSSEVEFTLADYDTLLQSTTSVDVYCEINYNGIYTTKTITLTNLIESSTESRMVLYGNSSIISNSIVSDVNSISDSTTGTSIESLIDWCFDENFNIYVTKANDTSILKYTNLTSGYTQDETFSLALSSSLSKTINDGRRMACANQKLFVYSETTSDTTTTYNLYWADLSAETPILNTLTLNFALDSIYAKDGVLYLAKEESDVSTARSIYKVDITGDTITAPTADDTPAYTIKITSDDSEYNLIGESHNITNVVITDMIDVNGTLYALFGAFLGYTEGILTYYKNFNGALYNATSGAWYGYKYLSDYTNPRATYDSETTSSTDSTSSAVSVDNYSFYLPERFLAISPKKLFISDDGAYGYTANTSSDDATAEGIQINGTGERVSRVTEFDIGNSSLTYGTDLSSYNFYIATSQASTYGWTVY